MNTSNLLLSILKKEEVETLKYFDTVFTNDKKTEIKFGYVGNEISITFFIYGLTENRKISLSEKLEILFNTDTDLKVLDEYLNTIKEPFKLHFSPYLEINNNPLTHSFRITINHN